ncbi:MAG: hypothetical protein IT228_05665 [Flavobacteriales bacterium]|nr:hypothetical protein [Flavobacteriales bacterium]MCC6576812.1 hypothetical protein [Flavobacteriales bacterium]
MTPRTLLRGLAPHGPCLALLALATPPALHAQNEDDALRIVSAQPEGTARSLGLGGAFGALGADPGALWINPAGMALYATSEFSATPALEVNDARATLLGLGTSNTDQRAHFSNLAMVLHSTSDKSRWKSRSFGVVFDRTASHHWERTARGEHLPSTLLQQFVDEANGTRYDALAGAYPFTADLAWQTFAIDTLAGDPMAYGIYGGGSGLGPTRQDHTISTAGANTNTAFHYSAGLDDRLFIGGALGVLGSRYERLTKHDETMLAATDSLDRFTYEERLVMRGSGVDLKFGVLGRVSDHLRIGAAVHSPSYFWMTDAYSTTMTTRFRAGDSYSYDSPDGSFQYRVQGPWRALLSVAAIVGRRGAISADYEYCDQRSTRLRRANALSDSYDFALENRTIGQVVRGVHAVRVGTEWRLGPAFLRGGFAHWTDPFTAGDLRHGEGRTRYSLGGGFRGARLSFDLALACDRSTGGYSLYDPALLEPVREERIAYRALFTVAFRP